MCYTLLIMEGFAASPYAVLYAAMLCLLGAGAVLWCLLKRERLLAWPLAGVCGVLFFLVLGLFGLDITRVWAADIAPATVTYRWMLFPAAATLLGTATVLLGVYGDHMSGEHAWEYRASVGVCLALSFVALVGIVLQPLFA